MKNKAIAITAKHKGNIQSFSVAKCLLHTRADGVRIVLCFNDSDGYVRFVVENVIGTLLLSSRVYFTPHVNPSICESNLFPNLVNYVPSHINQGRRDVLRANVLFAERFFVHCCHLFF